MMIELRSINQNIAFKEGGGMATISQRTTGGFQLQKILSLNGRLQKQS